MAIRKNADGSITVGILKDESKEKPEAAAEQPKRRAKQRIRGRGNTLSHP